MTKERNKEIARLYRHEGWLLTEICQHFGLSKAWAWEIICREGARLPKGMRQSRNEAAARRKGEDPAYREKMAEAMRKAWERGVMPGRPRLFADDPAKRELYEILSRKRIPASEIHRMMQEAA